MLGFSVYTTAVCCAARSFFFQGESSSALAKAISTAAEAFFHTEKGFLIFIIRYAVDDAQDFFAGEPEGKNVAFVSLFISVNHLVLLQIIPRFLYTLGVDALLSRINLSCPSATFNVRSYFFAKHMF